MDNVLKEILGLIAAYPFLKFVIVALIVIIQGETGIILFIFLFSKGQMHWFAFFVVSLVAIVIYESAIYSLGRLLRGTPLGSRIERSIKHHERIEKFLQEENSHIIALSKFIIYFSLAIVFLSGWMRISFKRFIKLRLLGATIWLIVMTALIYALTSTYGFFAGEGAFEHIEIVIPILILAIVAASRLVGKRMEKKLARASQV